MIVRKSNEGDENKGINKMEECLGRNINEVGKREKYFDWDG